MLFLFPCFRTTFSFFLLKLLLEFWDFFEICIISNVTLCLCNKCSLDYFILEFLIALHFDSLKKAIIIYYPFHLLKLPILMVSLITFVLLFTIILSYFFNALTRQRKHRLCHFSSSTWSRRFIFVQALKCAEAEGSFLYQLCLKLLFYNGSFFEYW